MIKKLNLSPIKVFFLLVFIHLVMEVIPGLVVEYLATPKDMVGVFGDYAGLLLGFIIVPSSWAFFVWLPRTVENNLTALSEGGIISQKDLARFHEIVNQVIEIAGKKYYVAVSIAIPIAITIFAQITMTQYDPPFWALTVPWYNYSFLLLKMALSFYIFVQYALWSVLLIILLNKIFKSIPITLIPYHFDNASGLGVVGEFSYGIGRIALIIGLFIIGEIATAITRGQGVGQLNILIEVIAFPILTIGFFLLPLITCRNGMVKAKKVILQGVGEKIQEAMKQINNKNEPSPNDFRKFNNLVSYQKKLRDDIHTWPISAELFRRFSLRFLISSIPGIFSVAMGITELIRGE